MHFVRSGGSRPDSSARAAIASRPFTNPWAGAMGFGGGDEAEVTTSSGQPAGSRPDKKQKGPTWTKIYGRTVDLTNFRHPGGNIVELFYGMDATTAFEAFHGHSKGAFNEGAEHHTERNVKH